MSADLLDVLLLLAQQRVEVLLVHDLHVRLCAQQGTYSEGRSTGNRHRKRTHAPADYIYTGCVATIFSAELNTGQRYTATHDVIHTETPAVHALTCNTAP
jgi:hypothetical protein